MHIQSGALITLIAKIHEHWRDLVDDDSDEKYFEWLEKASFDYSASNADDEDRGRPPGRKPAHAGNVRELATPVHWHGLCVQPQAAGAGERVRFRTAASGGNSDIPRDFMKVSVAAEMGIQDIVPIPCRM